MTKQSFASRMAAKAMPAAAARVFPDAWLEAGNDRILLRRIAGERRKSDGPRPDLLLRRRWDIATAEVAGRDLHVLTPRSGSTGRVLFYCHGGAYVVGPSTVEWLVAASLAHKVGADLALYDYPKSPEFDAPATLAASRDAWAATTAEYGASKTVIAGTSAGGGLAASVLLHAATTSSPMPRGALLISPWLDLATAHADAPTFDETDLLLSMPKIRRDGEIYAGSLDVTDPFVSPAYANDAALAELPPVLVTLGEYELFVPEGRALVDRINAAGGSARALIEPFGQHATSLGPLPDTAELRADVHRTVTAWFDSAVD